MASISITYTPNYEGCHRIYFKNVIDTEYCLYTDGSPSVIGETKTTVIELVGPLEDCIPLDSVVCTDYEINGYIQPCCAAESDISLRAPFEFTADTAKCNTYLVECLASGISAIQISNGADGYITPPTITILNGGDGVGFLYNVIRDGNAVESVDVISPGENYSPGATIVFSPSSTSVSATGYIEFCPCGTNCGETAAVTYNSCVNQAEESVSPPYGGASYKLCSQSLPVNQPSTKAVITRVGDTTCCECTSYTITNDDKTRFIDVIYIDCNNLLQQDTIPVFGSLEVCAITGTINITQDYLFTITNNGSCL